MSPHPRSPPPLSSTSLADPGQQAKQGQEDAVVGWLGPGSSGESLQQRLTAPFADHIVNSPAGPWGKEKRLCSQHPFPELQLSQTLTPHGAHKAPMAFQWCFIAINPRAFAELTMDPRCPWPGDMTNGCMVKLCALLPLALAVVIFTNPRPAEVFHCALKCSRE